MTKQGMINFIISIGDLDPSRKKSDYNYVKELKKMKKNQLKDMLDYWHNIKYGKLFFED